MKNKYEICGENAIIEIPHNNKILKTIIDKSDLSLVQELPNSWYAISSDSGFYVLGRVYQKNKIKYISLHRLLMNPDDNMVVDHINRDTLNNLKSNLRVITKAQNAQNRCAHKNNKSGHRGVYLDRGNWQAQVKVNGKKITLGYFKKISDAVDIVQKARAITMPFSEDAKHLSEQVKGMTLEDLKRKSKQKAQGGVM